MITWYIFEGNRFIQKAYNKKSAMKILAGMGSTAWATTSIHDNIIDDIEF